VAYNFVNFITQNCLSESVENNCRRCFFLEKKELSYVAHTLLKGISNLKFSQNTQFGTSENPISILVLGLRRLVVGVPIILALTHRKRHSAHNIIPVV